MKPLRTTATCIVLAVLFAAVPAWAAKSPVISLSPGTGYSGARVIVKGARFGTSETVSVSFDGALMGKAIANTSGSFSLSFTVPKSLAAGAYPVVATGKKSGLSARSVFSAKDPPSISLGPASDPAHALVTVTGTSFGNLETVNISFGDTLVALAATNSSGGFTQGFLVPAGAPLGYYKVKAAGQTSGLTAAATFTVTAPSPSAVLSLAAGPPTSQVAVAGYHFGIDEAVDVYFDTQDMVLASTAAGGSFSQNLVIPTGSLPGPHWITAVGRSSGLTAHAAFTVRTDWAQFHYGPRHSGYNPFENVLDASNVSGLGQAWTAVTGNSIISSPAVANGVVYVGSWDYNLHAFNASTGAELWTAATGGGIESSPAVANGVVYVGSGDNNLYAFNASSGAQLWKAATGGFIHSSPAVANGVVYVGSGDNDLYAFNASTGAQLWKTATKGFIHSSPAVANGVVCVGSDDHNLYVFDASTGAPYYIPPLATGGGVASSPAVADGVAYVGSLDGNLYAFNAIFGLKLWTAATGASIYSSPAVANGVVYVGSEDGKLYAFSASTGAQLWNAPTDGSIYSSPAVANGVVYVAGDKNLYAFDAGYGVQLWMAATAGGIASSPAVVNGMVYVASGGWLYAYDLAAGMSGSSPVQADRRSSAAGETASGPPNPADLTPDFSLELR